MILLDTNIISEMMKKAPDAQVVAWLDAQAAADLYISSVSIAEIIYGLKALPAGNRRQLLENAFNKVLEQAFEHRILSFDEVAASYYGKIMSHRKALGRPMSILDGQIASIALAQGAILATHNIRDFKDCKLELVNPF